MEIELISIVDGLGIVAAEESIDKKEEKTLKK